MTRAAVLILALLAAACGGSPTQSTSPFADDRAQTASALHSGFRAAMRQRAVGS